MDGGRFRDFPLINISELFAYNFRQMHWNKYQDSDTDKKLANPAFKKEFQFRYCIL